jgi:hypothetical protein
MYESAGEEEEGRVKMEEAYYFMRVRPVRPW